MPDETVYKIRRRTDGLFSTGGAYPNFTKTGKAWSNIAYLKTHFKVVEQIKIYDNCEVVRFIRLELRSETIPQFLCKHEWVSGEPDRSGGSDHSMECSKCGKVK